MHARLTIVLAHFEIGAVTIALVRSVARQKACLLHPDVAVRITRPDLSSNPRDLVSRLLGVGEVLPVRVLRDAQGRLALRLDDIEDDEDVRPALPFVEGRPAWLVAGRDLSTTIPAAETPAAEPTDSTPDDELAIESPAPASPRPAPGPGRRPAGPTAVEPVPTRTLVQQLQGQVEMLRRENLRLRGFETEATNAAAIRLELGQEHAASPTCSSSCSCSGRNARPATSGKAHEPTPPPSAPRTRAATGSTAQRTGSGTRPTSPGSNASPQPNAAATP